MVVHPRERTPASVPWSAMPLFARLREHHCRAPHAPLDVPLAPDGVADDVLEAWLPCGLAVREASVRLPSAVCTRVVGGADERVFLCGVQGAVEVCDPATGETTRYDTFRPGADEPYARGAKHAPATAGLGGALDDGGVAHADDAGDTVEYVSSGVSDILITGEVRPPF